MAVFAHMAMSLDGYVADPDGGIDQLFGWYFGGDVEVPTAQDGLSFRTDPASAEVLRRWLADIGALVAGRRTFDQAGGWGGTHPVGVPVFVVTHSVPEGWPLPGSSVGFVTEGPEAALAKAVEAAGDKDVVIATPDITRQLLDAGLLDEVHVSLVPVLLGWGSPSSPTWREPRSLWRARRWSRASGSPTWPTGWSARRSTPGHVRRAGRPAAAGVVPPGGDSGCSPGWRGTTDSPCYAAARFSAGRALPSARRTRIEEERDERHRGT
jgi:dihydrofolate reductase